MMSILKRALPFILTLLVGVGLGNLLQRDGRPEAGAVGATRSCMMRGRPEMPPLPPPPPPAFESDVYTQKDVTRKAVIGHKPQPSYTVEARRNNLTGTVRLRLVLAADGTVRNIVPLTTLPDGLTEQAVEAARDIEFTPAMMDGRAVSQYATIEYNFNIY